MRAPFSAVARVKANLEGGGSVSFEAILLIQPRNEADHRDPLRFDPDGYRPWHDRIPRHWLEIQGRSVDSVPVIFRPGATFTTGKVKAGTVEVDEP